MIEKLSRAICAAGGGDPDRLLEGRIRNIAGEFEWDEAMPNVRSDTPEQFYRYKLWRCFQTEARAAIEFFSYREEDSP